MSSSLTAVRPRGSAGLATSEEADEQRIRRRVGVAYGLLVFNTMTFYPGVAFIHIPSAVGKGIAQAALPLALLVILSPNRCGLVRPNLFLCLVSLLVLGAFLATMEPQHFGTIYRTFRLAGFVFALWLLTPWWGCRRARPAGCHVKAYSILLGSAVVGLMVSPHKALAAGRLTGAVWPIPPTQLAHYAAVVVGVVVILWFCGHMRGRTAAIATCGSGIILILTHTRTALAAMVAAILVAGLSLIVAKARVRKLFAIAGAMAGVAIITLSGFITSWLARGEGTTELTNLTGRTKVWGPLLAFPRNKFQEIFGFGLSNSFVRRTSHRQQLARVLPGPRSVRGGCLRNDTGFPSGGVLLSAARRAAGASPLLRDILPCRVVYRGRLHRRLSLPSRSHPSCLAACAIPRGQ